MMDVPGITIVEMPHGAAAWREAVKLRERILRAPLGLEFSPEELAAESGDLHLGAFEAVTGAVIGCLVLSPVEGKPGVCRMRQVAVTESRREEGIGAALVMRAEVFAAARGFREMTLHARESVAGFYERLGYAAEGSPFVEVTIPHRAMRKTLEAPTESG